MYERFTDGELRGWIHRDFHSALPSPGWIPSSEPPPDSLLKDSPETTVYRLAPPGWPGEVVVKRYNRPGRFRRWKDLLRVPRAFRSLRGAAGFLRMGLPTPEPLAALALRRGGNRSWLVTRALNGYRSLAETPDRRDLIPDLVDLIRRMHERGITHGDLKPVNILVRITGEERLFSLVDLDAARLRKRTSLRQASRDLAQLDSYAVRDCTMEERRAFFRRYSAGWDRGTRREVLGWILDESGRREARRCAV